MFKGMGTFLLDHLLEDADIFGLLNLDRERLIRIGRLIWLVTGVTENKTVEEERLRGIRFFKDL